MHSALVVWLRFGWGGGWSLGLMACHPAGHGSLFDPRKTRASQRLSQVRFLGLHFHLGQTLCSRIRSRSRERQKPHNPEWHNASGSVKSVTCWPVFGGSHGPRRRRIPSPTGAIDSHWSKPASGGFMDCSSIQSPKVCAGIAEWSCNRPYSVDSCPEVSKGIVFGGSTSDAASALPESKPLPTRLRNLP